MLDRLNQILDTRRRRRVARSELAHLDARLLADVGLRRTGLGERVVQLNAD